MLQLQSLIGRWFGAKPVPRRAPTVAAMPSAPPVVRPDPSAQSTVVGARRPLVNPEGAVAGFEFHLGQAIVNRLQVRGEDLAIRAHVHVLLAAMRRCAQGGHFAYAELPASWLPLVSPDGPAQGLQLALGAVATREEASAMVASVTAWRKAGARIGWREDEPPVAGLAPDFILSHITVPRHGVAWVAPDLDDVDGLEAALRSGALWAGSAVRIGTEPRELRALPPQARRLMQLLNRLVRDDDTAAVVNEIKQDAALSVRLLQHLNSPGVSRGHALASIEQAVAVLGRDALYHWVSGLLVRMSPPRPAAATLQALAIARARLLESFGRAAGEPTPGSLYLMGLGSVLPLLMQISLADALTSLHLPGDAERALLQRDGPWAGYLGLVESLEEPDLPAARLLAEPMGGLDAVMAMSARAWLPP
ncbi:HDOD domain-containing protein [Ideonella sp. A 288]|uniref:HDOD domain-containing protein n=1 Tax=Ideonella sp. A 288 TaxID=1962181 RepID=UPI000B4B2CEB|nr:HDOD domain-containing protein [Ideonella sp. A 288]